jgi:hypothetical protein
MLPMLAGMMPGMPMMPPPPIKMYNVKIKRCIKSGEIRGAILPREDFLYDPNSFKVDARDGLFYADKTRMTRSQAKQKYPKKAKIIDEAPVWVPAIDDGSEKDVRDPQRWKFGSFNTNDKSVEEIEITECYAKVDFDNDGVAEWRQICVVGTGSGKDRHILSNTEWAGELPYTAITPNPMPHRFRGRSVYDDIGPIQRVKTAVLRQHNDNLYLHQNPTKLIFEDAIVNKDALEDAEMGVTIWANRPPGDAVTWLQIPYIGDKALSALEYFDMVMEKRTGVSRSTLALDTDTLQYQTKAAVDATRSTAFSKIETYARNIAECGGYRELFSKILKLVIQNQKSIKKIKIRGEWVTLDPRGWDADMKVSINVGLGAGSRDADLQALGGIAQKQELVIQALGDPMNPVLGISEYFETCRQMVEAAGLKNPERFFPVLDKQQVQQIAQQRAQSQPPPPEVMKLQAEMSMRDKELQAEQQRDQNRAVLDTRNAQAANDKEMVQAQADIATQNRKTQAEIDLNQRRFENERELKMLDHALKRDEMLGNLEIKRNEAMMRQREMFAKHEMAQQDEDPEVMVARADATRRRNGANAQRDADMQAREQQRDAMHAQNMAALSQALTHLGSSMMAPTTVIRDPKTGRVMGARKGG